MNAHTPLVSVIIPTYNRSDEIAKSIESVLKQSYSNIEVIIIDDGSIDNTEELIKNIDDERVVYFYQNNQGTSSARNKGILLSNGKYIAFQDSDDEWLFDKLRRQVEILEGLGNKVAVCYCDMKRINLNGLETYWKAPHPVNTGDIISNNTLDYQVYGIGIQTVLVRKICVDEIGYFDLDLDRFIDLEWLIRLSLKFNFEYINEPLVNFYESKGISTNSKALINARKKIYSKYERELKKNNLFVISQKVRIAEAYWKDNDIKKSREFALKTIKEENKINLFFSIKLLVFILIPYRFLRNIPKEFRQYFK